VNGDPDHRKSPPSGAVVGASSVPKPIHGPRWLRIGSQSMG
jgi:hypothetical protein